MCPARYVGACLVDVLTVVVVRFRHYVWIPFCPASVFLTGVLELARHGFQVVFEAAGLQVKVVD